MSDDLQLIAEITLRTLWICGSALVIALAVGMPIGIALGLRHFAGRGVMVSSINAGMGAPPVVVGLAGAMLLSRSGPLGELNLIYSPAAMILTSTLIALPLVIGLTLAAVGALDEDEGTIVASEDAVAGMVDSTRPVAEGVVNVAVPSILHTSHRDRCAPRFRIDLRVHIVSPRLRFTSK